MFVASRQIIKNFTVKCGICYGKRLQSNSFHPRDQTSPYLKCGQPTHISHPFLVSEKEITPDISRQEFEMRRQRLMLLIKENAGLLNQLKSHCVIIPSATKVYMSEKIPYIFRQNTDFLYFSGCQEPNTILVLTAVGDAFTSILFVNPKDQHLELWEGPRTGIENSLNFFGVNRALPVMEFEKFLISFLKEHKNTLIWYDNSTVLQRELHEKLNQLLKLSNRKCASPKTLFHKIRSIKSEREIYLMHKSCDIASAAIINTIKKSEPRMTEHQLFATVDYECRMKGAEFLAYPAVVAGGSNANIIHYIANNQLILAGDMVLIDAGCEYHGYSSDITRTWPISGKFTPEQKILYEVVLNVQKHLLERVNELPTLNQLYHYMCSLLGVELKEIGLIPKSYMGDKLLSAVSCYCPHHVSHYLGMDVHDTATVSTDTPLQPGMVITVEPGLYVNPKISLAPPNFHGLGIRIEDDVLITENGSTVLSSKCPKEIDEIEKLASHSEPWYSYI